jgi:hypothetical protein
MNSLVSWEFMAANTERFAHDPCTSASLALLIIMIECGIGWLVLEALLLEAVAHAFAEIAKMV